MKKFLKFFRILIKNPKVPKLNGTTGGMFPGNFFDTCSKVPSPPKLRIKSDFRSKNSFLIFQDSNFSTWPSRSPVLYGRVLALIFAKSCLVLSLRVRKAPSSTKTSTPLSTNQLLTFMKGSSVTLLSDLDEFEGKYKVLRRRFWRI